MLPNPKHERRNQKEYHLVVGERKSEHKTRTIKIRSVFCLAPSNEQIEEYHHKQIKQRKYFRRHAIEKKEIITYQHACGKHTSNPMVGQFLYEPVNQGDDNCVGHGGKESYAPGRCRNRNLRQQPTNRCIEWIPRRMRDTKCCCGSDQVAA